MARKFEYKPGCYGWAMEKCEEKLLIAAFSEIDNRISPDQNWKAEFLDHFYQHGSGVTFDTIAQINAQRRRQNLEPLEYRETTVYEYARSADRLHKSELRRQLRDEFLALDSEERVRWKNDAEDQTAGLLAPHLTHGEWKQLREGRSAPPAVLSSRERAMRVQAVEKPVGNEPRRQETVHRSVRQLKLAKKPETIAKIMAQLTPDDALTVAESGEIQDTEFWLKLLLLDHWNVDLHSGEVVIPKSQCRADD